MTIKQYIKEKGWNLECDDTTGKVMSVDISFINSEGREDETEFDIKSYDANELSDLFADFCRENGYERNTVVSVVIVKTAESMEELE